jgi:AAA family ATP:ADP antiporter
VTLVKWLGTANMFLVAAAILEPSIWCMRYIERHMPARTPLPVSPPTAAEPASVRPPPSALDGMRRTLASPILLLMALEMFAYTFISTLYSYQVNVYMENAIPSRDARTMYWAGIYNSINIMSIVTQALVTWTVTRMKRPWIGLLLMPLCQLFGSIFLLWNPELIVAPLKELVKIFLHFPLVAALLNIPVVHAVAEVLTQSFRGLYIPGASALLLAAVVGILRYALNYSTGRAIRELFFTPLSREDKYQAKGFIDTLVFRAGDGMGSALLLSWLVFFPASPGIDISIIISTVLSLLIIINLGWKYEEMVTDEKKARSGHEKASTS